MKQFEDKVAVITGGASGLGLAMARRFGAAGMKIMIADIESDNLSAAVKSLSELNIHANGVLCCLLYTSDAADE